MKDFDRELMFSKDKNAFAIELEIHTGLQDKCMSIYPECTFSTESSEIIEINNFHYIQDVTPAIRKKERREKAIAVFDFLKDHYKNKFPMGQDGWTSGGNHFHLFGNVRVLKLKNLEINALLLACPLFAKFNRGGTKLYSRKNYRHKFSDERYIRYEDKDFSICTKTNKTDYDAIEFRCNNVIDDRILGYYQAICIMAHNNMSLLSMSDKCVHYLKVGCLTTTDNVGRGDVVLSKLAHHTMNEDEKVSLSSNIYAILALLKRNGLKESAKALAEYSNEHNLLIKEEGLCQECEATSEVQ